MVTVRSMRANTALEIARPACVTGLTLIIVEDVDSRKAFPSHARFHLKQFAAHELIEKLGHSLYGILKALLTHQSISSLGRLRTIFMVSRLTVMTRCKSFSGYAGSPTVSIA